MKALVFAFERRRGLGGGVSSPSSSSSYKWELLALLWVANLLNQGDRQIFNAILPLIQSGIGATDVQMGLVAAIFTACFGLLVPVAGWLGDRVSRKRIVWLSLLVFSAGTLLTGVSGGLISLIIFRSVATGAGESFYTPSAVSLIGEHHVQTRSLALALNQTSQYVGIVASSWLAAWLAERFGWRAAFWAFGGFGVILAGVLVWRLRPDEPATRSGAGTPMAKDPWITPSAVLLTLAFACMAFVATGFVTWMPTLLHTKFSLSLTEAAFQAVFGHFLFAFVGVMLGGWWADRRARTKPVARLQIGAAGLVLGAPFIFLMGTADSLTLVYVALAGFGLFRGLYDASIFAALYEVVPARRRATATGLMVCFAYVTGALSPLLLGYVKSRAGLDLGMAWLAPVFLVGGLLIALAAGVFFPRDHQFARSQS